MRPYVSIAEFLGGQRAVRATLNPSFGRPVPELFQDRMSRGVSIFDIDETLTMKSEKKVQLVQEALRRKDELAQAGKPYDPGIWDDFHDVLRHDKVNPHMEEIFREAREDHSVVMLTARGQAGRQNTIDWAREHDLMPDALITRPLSLDGVRSATYKEKMLDRRIPASAKIHALYDDDPGVLDMAQKRGIETVAVQDHIPRMSTARRAYLQQQQVQGAHIGMPLERIRTMNR